MTDTDRPEPLKDAARAGMVRTAALAIVAALVAFGVIDHAAGEALTDAATTGALTPGAVSPWSAGGWRRARPSATPAPR